MDVSQFFCSQDFPLVLDEIIDGSQIIINLGIKPCLLYSPSLRIKGVIHSIFYMVTIKQN